MITNKHKLLLALTAIALNGCSGHHVDLEPMQDTVFVYKNIDTPDTLLAQNPKWAPKTKNPNDLLSILIYTEGATKEGVQLIKNIANCYPVNVRLQNIEHIKTHCAERQ